MPQSERSQIIKEMLMWIAAKNKKDGGVTLREIINHTSTEITELGATKKTIRKYIESLRGAGFISLDGYKVKCTQTGKNWLEKKVS